MIELEEVLSGDNRQTASARVSRLLGRSGVPQNESSGSARIVETYPYVDESGSLLFEVVRYQPKDFKQRRPKAGGGWIWNVKGVRSVPYRLPKICAAHTIYVVEGERDVHTLEGWGLTATCNPGGAGKWRHEHSGYLKAKHVIILPDNDPAGEAHAAGVRDSLQSLAASVRLLPLPGLPPKGDVSEWKEMGGTAEGLRLLLQDSASAPEQSPRTFSDGRGFRCDESGVYLIDPAGRTKDGWICPQLEVLAHTRDFNGDGWGSRVRFRNREGHERTCVLSFATLAGEGREPLEKLLDMGFRPRRDRKSIEAVKDYIYQAEPKRFIRCVNSVGWHDGVYVLPDKSIGPAGHEEVLFYSEVATDHKYRVAGSLDEWRQHVSRLCVGNSRLVFAVSCAFAAPLLDLLKAESCGFHSRGISSTGKTTGLLVAGSVFGGNPQTGFLDTWRATANGMEARAALHNHGLLCLDEIGEVRDSELGEIVYALGNGAGKSRMTKGLTCRANTHFKLLFLSTGERSLADVMQSAGKQAKGGQEARLTEIPADAGAGMGIFEELHEYESPDMMARSLARAAKAYYGSPILSFLQAVSECREDIEPEIRDVRDKFLKRVPKGSSGEVFRVASSIGIVAAGGELATRLGITGWQAGDATLAAWACYSAWLESRGGTGARDIEAGVRAVRTFIQVNGASRFQLLGETDVKVINRAGFKEPLGNEWVYYLIPAVFQDEVCRGYDYREIVKELIRRGYLKRGDGNHFPIRKRIEGLGSPRLYAVLPGLFSEEEGGDMGTVGTDQASS